MQELKTAAMTPEQPQAAEKQQVDKKVKLLTWAGFILVAVSLVAYIFFGSPLF